MELVKSKIVWKIFGVFSVFNILLVLFYSPFVNYAYKRECDLPNFILLLASVPVSIAAYIILYKFRDKLVKIYGKGYIAAAILFLVEIYWTCNAYFRTGWDAGDCVYPAAIELSYGWPVSDSYYFSMCPNNVLVCWIQSKILKWAWRYSILDAETGVMCLVAFNCLLSVLAGFLLHRVVGKIRGEYTALFVWLVYVVYMGVSPWLLVSYTDTMVILFPILLIFLYIQDKLNLYVKWFLMGLIGLFSYYIKPQGLIVLIAIVLIEILEALKSKKWKPLCKTFITMFAGCICAVGCYVLIFNDTGMELDEDVSFGISHYFMMGLNSETNGGYYQEDAIFSNAIAEPAERTRENLRISMERVKEYGVVGMIEHLLKKQMSYFADGALAYGEEGQFWAEIYEKRNSYISGMIRSLYYEGENFHYMETYMQFFWIWILAFMGTAVLAKEKNKVLAACMLSILGITLFELLFEVRARHLYGFVPVLLVLAIVGFEEIVERLQVFMQKSKKVL